MKQIEPTQATGLEEMTDRALLRVLEECQGSESPIFIEVMRRLLRQKTGICATIAPLSDAQSTQQKVDASLAHWAEAYEKQVAEGSAVLFDKAHWENDKGEKVD